ncbi:MAG: type II secretion system F family protein [Candidatus Aenigmatarchaeota archaeon]
MLKNIALKLSSFGLKHFPEYFKPLNETIRLANIGILFEIYVGRMILLSLVSFIVVFLSMFLGLSIFLNLPMWFSIPGSLLLSAIIALVILVFFHSYPYHVLSSKRASIENNLPFALNHMSAIAASGVPPTVIFRLLAEVEEYGKVAEESAMIIRNMKTFGMDMITAIRQVADRTPSTTFREFLYSIISTIETGGDIHKFLEGMAREAMFEYRLRREKYLSTLTTYADFYTAVLIAAPLFFISVLSIMSMLGGTIGGLPILTVMEIGIYVFIPLLNIVFIAFVHLTQPTI